TPSDTVALALAFEHAVEELMDLRHRVRTAVRKDGVERASDERLHNAIDDRVSEIFLALEVIVEVPFPDSALTQDVVDGSAVIAAQMDEPGRGVEDLISGRRPLRSFGRRRSRRHHSRLNVYQPVGTDGLRQEGPCQTSNAGKRLST